MEKSKDPFRGPAPRKASRTPRTFRGRLFGYMLAVVLTLAFFSTAVSLLFIWRDIQAQILRLATHLVQVTTDKVTLPLLADDREGLQKAIEAQFPEPGLRAIFVYSPSGQLLASAGHKSIPPGLLAPGPDDHDLFTTQVQISGMGAVTAVRNPVQIARGELLDIPQTRHLPSETLGWVGVVLSHQPFFANWRRTLFSQILLMILYSLGAVGIARYLSKRIADPVTRLCEATRHIGRGDLDYPLPGTPDSAELAQLTTDFKAMVAGLRAKDHALAKAKERWETTFDSISDPIVLTDDGGRILQTNQALPHRVGLPPQGILGRTVQDLLALPPPPVRDRGQRNTRHMEIPALDMVAEAAIYPAPEPDLWIYVLRDVTEEERLQQQLIQVQKMEAIGTLAGGTAHEFNNILQAIAAYAALLQNAIQPSDERGQEYLARIQKSIQRAGALTKGLLSFARSHELEKTILQPASILKEIHRLVRQTFPKTLDVGMELGEELWTIEANAHQLHQVLLNLCLNARDAMPTGGRLILRAENVMRPSPNANGETAPNGKGRKWVRLQVEDTGSGIPADIRERIFDPFYTTKEVGKGTGLGLAVVYGIVKSHGGFIEVTSEDGQGSRFDVYFPAVRPVAPSQDQTAMPLPGHGTLLIIDDEAAVREGLAAALHALGYEVLKAGDGEEGWSLFAANEERLDLVLLDVLMPRVEGTEVLERIRRKNPGIPVLVLTGYLERDKEEAVKALGPAQILKKPCDLPSLTKAIFEAMEGPSKPSSLA